MAEGLTIGIDVGGSNAFAGGFMRNGTVMNLVIIGLITARQSVAEVVS